MTNRNFFSLLDKTLRCARSNAFYILVSYFVMSLFCGIVSAAFLTPIFMLKIPENLKFAVIEIGAFFSSLFYFLMLYGFSSMLLAMQRGKFVTFGFLFNGFRQKKSALPVSAVFSGVIAAIIGTINLISKIPAVQAALQNYHPATMAGFIALPLILIGFVILLPYALTFYSAIDGEKLFDSKAKRPEGFYIGAFFKESRSLLKGHKLGLIGFVIACGGNKLLIAIVASITSICLSKIGAGQEGSNLNLLSHIIDFIYIFNFYTAFVRMNLAVPFYYGHLKYSHNEDDDHITIS